MRLTDSEKRAIRTYARMTFSRWIPWTDAHHTALYAVQNAAAGSLGQDWCDDDFDFDAVEERFWHNLDVGRRWKRRFGGGA